MRRAAALVCAGALLAAVAPAVAVRVPFVGCPSDGQAGPVAPPTIGISPDVPPDAAPKLAYYAVADGPAVLAPRGWHCFGSYGSNGASLLVAPTPLDWHVAVEIPVAGPAVQLSLANGSTSGRFEVARVAARLFPAARPFVERVEAEGLEPPFARGPFAADRVTHRGSDRALFTTPANARGLGTEATRLARGPLPIDGVAILLPNDEDDLVLLAARLPPALRPLASVIVRQVKPRT